MKISVIGAGAWGTALAVNAAARHDVVLWARDATQAERMTSARENVRYLRGIHFPTGLSVQAVGQGDFVDDAQLVIVATPMAALRGQLEGLRGTTVPVVWLCKGVESALVASDGKLGQQPFFGLLAHEIQAQVAPELTAGVLSGPGFAQEVAQSNPTALVAASPHAVVRDALIEAFHGPSLRVYANDDIVGVEVGGAVKNVLAIATGLCDGLALGFNARAALITRGLAEMTRFGVALGARTETFMGLSGLGDLVLTATGDLSRNRKIGLLLAEGRSLEQAVASLGHVAEGVYCARTVVQRARHLGIDMPIAEGVVALLDGSQNTAAVVAALMGREPSAEGG